MATSSLPMPAPAAAPPPAPTPGAKTSEGVFTALSILLGALPMILQALGVKQDISPFVQAIGLVISGLSGIHFTAQRTSLKRAHLAALGASAPAASSKIAAALAASAVLLLGATFAVGSCGGTSPTITQIGSAAGSAAEAGLQCEGVDLEGLVGFGSDANLSVLEAIGKDVLQSNYASAIGDLLKGLTSITVGCAVLTADDLLAGLEQGAGSGSAAPATSLTTASAQLSLSRLRELEKTYGWKRAPRKQFKRAALAPPTARGTVAAEPAVIDLATVRRQRAAAGSNK